MLPLRVLVTFDDLRLRHFLEALIRDDPFEVSDWLARWCMDLPKSNAVLGRDRGAERP